MTYEEFKSAYTTNFNWMMTYKPDECGSLYYCEKLSALSEEYPDFELRMESEVEVES